MSKILILFARRRWWGRRPRKTDKDDTFEPEYAGLRSPSGEAALRAGKEMRWTT